MRPASYVAEYNQVTPMKLEPGSRLSHYEIQSSLGAGGMGEVYRARDTELGREVAIKLVREDFVEDAERLARFRREARVLASLRHPNIATLHGFDSAVSRPDDSSAGAEHEVSFLVMELVPGDTLAERIRRGPLPVEDAIAFFLQIAAGLEAAHGQGIVHRDLKPANLKIDDSTESLGGVAKILDFGLAKSTDSGDGRDVPSVTNSPTLTAAATRKGEILGTAAYMSPEQAEGRDVDARTDIWAFGVCLLEALTGSQVFEGANAASVVASVIKDEPRLDLLPDHPATPTLRRLLRRCLAKKREDRLPHIGAARLELQDAAGQDLDESADVSRAVASKRPWLWAVALAALAAIVAGGLAWRLKPSASGPLVRSVLSAPPSRGAQPGIQYSEIAISANGRTVVYRTQESLYVRSVDQLEGRPLEGTGGGHSPSLSPDGAWVAFAQGSTLNKVSLEGGRPIEVCEVGEGIVVYPRWEADGTILFGIHLGDSIYRVASGGGEPEVVFERDREVDAGVPGWPQLLPGRRHLLFTWLEQHGQGKIAVLDLETREHRVVHPQGGRATYAPTGHLVFGDGNELLAAPFELRSHTVTGNPVRVIEGVARSMGRGAHYGLAGDGSLAYITADTAPGLEALVWVDRQGRETPLGLRRPNLGSPRISYDGERVALSFGLELWTWDTRQSSPTRLTGDEQADIYAVWGRDDREIFYSSGPIGRFDLYRKSADGAGSEERLTSYERALYPNSLSPDGRSLIFLMGTRPPHDLGVLDLDGGEPRLLLAEAHDELNGEISPNGRYLAYQSNESGQWEVYVRPYPDVDSGRFKVSVGGGAEPLWGPDGRELFYRVGDAVLVVPVTATGTFVAGAPQELFRGRYRPASLADMRRNYDIHPSGDRFLMTKVVAVPDRASSQVVLVQNWLEEVERLVPGN